MYQLSENRTALVIDTRITHNHLTSINISLTMTIMTLHIYVHREYPAYLPYVSHLAELTCVPVDMIHLCTGKPYISVTGVANLL